MKSSEYNRQPSIIWRRLFRQPMPCALVLDLAKAGSNMLARMAMMAMTTSSSMRVKPGTRGASERRPEKEILAVFIAVWFRVNVVYGFPCKLFANFVEEIADLTKREFQKIQDALIEIKVPPTEIFSCDSGNQQRTTHYHLRATRGYSFDGELRRESTLDTACAVATFRPVFERNRQIVLTVVVLVNDAAGFCRS